MNHSKALVMLALATSCSVTVGGVSVPSQAKTAATTKATAQPAPSQEFMTFWETFKDALRKNDKSALADMTKLPYILDEKKLDKAGFVAKSETLFPASARQCLLRGKPVPDKGEVYVFCGEAIYVFAKDQGKYKFTDIGVND